MQARTSFLVTLALGALNLLACSEDTTNTPASTAGAAGSTAGQGGSSSGSGGSAQGGSSGSSAQGGSSGTSGQGGAAGAGGGASGQGGASGASGQGGSAGAPGGAGGAGGSGGSGGSGGTGGSSGSGGTSGQSGAAGGPGNPNAEATCEVPAEAGLEDVSKPTTVVGSGTAASCTSKAFVEAVAKGGVITFNCGADPVTIVLEETAKVFNDKGPKVVIDGGGKVTLSGGGKHRILYQNTCDQKQIWTTSHCQNQDHPQLTVQNLTFKDGNSKGEEEYDGGGAIWVRGGRFKILNSRFETSECADVGPDVGGAAVRVFSQHEGKPVYVVNSTFGGAEGRGNRCANGGGISSIGVSWTIVNSLFSHNRAVGNGGNPAQAGTPGGGSGGAIYNDGNEMTLRLCGTRIEYNQANAHGSAIFFVSNNKTGQVFIDRSVIKNNSGGSWYPKYPQISHHPETPINVTASIIE